MKRVGYLIEQIADWNNLNLAFYKASRGKSRALEVCQYRKSLHENLKKLQEEILSGNVSVGKYKYFKIFDPKERVICAASFDERVLHHAIMNICHPVFEKTLIYDTYATRINKGIYKALGKSFQQMHRYSYVAKLDFRKYFDNISHEKLISLLATKFKDKHLLLIFEKIIRSYETSSAKGIPIGNLTSQYFANFYLSGLDHYIKETLRVSFYVRYMDDMLLLSNDKEQLKFDLEKIKEYSHSLGLTLKPIVYNKTENGVSFLGYRLFPHKILLNKTSKRRFLNKHFEYENNLQQNVWEQIDYKQHIVPLWAFCSKAYSKRLKRELLEGSNRVLRGGSWNNNAQNCRVANRNNNTPSSRNSNNGFRLISSRCCVG